MRVGTEETLNLVASFISLAEQFLEKNKFEKEIKSYNTPIIRYVGKYLMCYS